MKRHVHVLHWRRHPRHTHLTHRAHMDVPSLGTDTPYAVYTNTRTHTTNLLLPDEDTRVVKALPRHTRDTDTDLRNGFADAHRLTEARGYTHAVRTQKHTETHGHAWTPQAQTHVRVRPTDPQTHMHTRSLFKKCWWHLSCVLGFFWSGDPAVRNADMVPAGEGNKARQMCALCGVLEGGRG